MENNDDEKYKRWAYPSEQEEPAFDKIDLSTIHLLSLEISKRFDQESPNTYRAKAPLSMVWGDFFHSFLLNYNYKFEDAPIEYLDESGKYYEWFFYTKPKHWWQFRKYIDPSLTISENKLNESSIIVATRIKVDSQDIESTNKPPAGILRQGKEALEHYISAIEKEKNQTKYLFEAKLLIIGEGGTGKTTFARKIKNSKAPMPEEKETTLGISISKWFFEASSPQPNSSEQIHFYVNLWDFGGQKIYHGTHQIFFTNQSFYVLIADTREQTTDFSYWLNTVEQLGGEDSSLIIILNKKFGHIEQFDEVGYRNQFGKIIKEVILIDLKEEEMKISLLQSKLKMYLMNLPGIGDALPPSWVAIRENLLQEKQNFISLDKFRTICSENNVDDLATIDTLSRYFHRIGVFTHYVDDPMLSNRIYLNSNWLIKIIYQILDSEITRLKRGRIASSDIKSIWANSELHYEINNLIQLMNRFGLMYHVPNSNEYIVPSHLPIEMPYKEWEYANTGVLLQFVYEFDRYVPKGIMSRVIVGLNHLIINQSLIWHKGLNISLNDAHAEIIESYGATNKFMIRIAGFNKKELLAVIRERFNEIIKPFNKLNYKQLVPCICDICKNSNDPAFHDFTQLHSFNLRDISFSQCNKTGKMVKIEDLLELTSPKVQSHKINISNNATTKLIKIFLASSSELINDRKEFEIFINRENKKLNPFGIFLQLELWEDFSDGISQTRLQDEYNKLILGCDIFCSLVFSKIGKYTAEEFQQAFTQFKNKGKPIIYTYFKDAPVSINKIKKDDINSRLDFEEKLKTFGHFPTGYKNIEDLKYQFKMQLDKYISSLG